MKIIAPFLILCLVASNFCNAQLISSDDKLHLAAGALISAGTYTYIYSTTKNKKKAFWFSLGASAAAGLMKEVYDSTKDGNRFDTGEAVATTIGGLTVSLTFQIFAGKNK
jgi:uncharacterized protein YfiM (DUF2279 family)